MEDWVLFFPGPTDVFRFVWVRRLVRITCLTFRRLRLARRSKLARTRQLILTSLLRWVAVEERRKGKRQNQNGFFSSCLNSFCRSVGGSGGHGLCWQSSIRADHAPSVRSRVLRISPMVSKPASRPLRDSSLIQPITFFSAEITVEWFRPPKNRPISL
jgi:hypothetical protein